MGEPICGCGSCVPTVFPISFLNQGLDYVPYPMQNSPLEGDKWGRLAGLSHGQDGH